MFDINELNYKLNELSNALQQWQNMKNSVERTMTNEKKEILDSYLDFRQHHKILGLFVEPLNIDDIDLTEETFEKYNKEIEKFENSFQELLMDAKLEVNKNEKQIIQEKKNKKIENKSIATKINKKIIYECLLVNSAYQNELSQYGDNEYSMNHINNAGYYENLANEFYEILNFNGQTEQEFMSHMSSLAITSEQKKSLVELRKHPMFKKLTGETALKQKKKLETVLQTKITLAGMTFNDENSTKVAVKTIAQLEQEFNIHSNKLSLLLSCGVISGEQYDEYNQLLEYIYTYYESYSKGELIPFRKMTNKQYEILIQQAEENGVSFEEELQLATEDIRYEFEKVQELQSQCIKKSI